MTVLRAIAIALYTLSGNVHKATQGFLNKCTFQILLEKVNKARFTLIKQKLYNFSSKENCKVHKAIALYTFLSKKCKVHKAYNKPCTLFKQKCEVHKAI